ncbi:hypothetical protein PR048_005227 [Dryococelus australis]|uniref:Uncharacterized protein n=1 Tax=Dryococelus australis TaxID=614101 RepID=A0ABQ9I7P1_9NEOP|nr:hypothetical protein PR048_005227 [Dryococelus australis]
MSAVNVLVDKISATGLLAAKMAAGIKGGINGRSPRKLEKTNGIVWPDSHIDPGATPPGIERGLSCGRGGGVVVAGDPDEGSWSSFGAIPYTEGYDAHFSVLSISLLDYQRATAVALTTLQPKWTSERGPAQPVCVTKPTYNISAKVYQVSSEPMLFVKGLRDDCTQQYKERQIVAQGGRWTAVHVWLLIQSLQGRGRRFHPEKGARLHA